MRKLASGAHCTCSSTAIYLSPADTQHVMSTRWSAYFHNIEFRSEKKLAENATSAHGMCIVQLFAEKVFGISAHFMDRSPDETAVQNNAVD